MVSLIVVAVWPWRTSRIAVGFGRALRGTRATYPAFVDALAALTADMTSLASGMFQGRISTGQPRLFRDYIEFLDLSAPMERSSPDVSNLDLRLRLAMDRATKMGMTAENQILDFERSNWRQRSEKQK